MMCVNLLCGCVARVSVSDRLCVGLIAGAGGVGCFAIQLAKLAGATVITTCGNLNVKFMEKLGADHNFNYRGLTEVQKEFSPS